MTRDQDRKRDGLPQGLDGILVPRGFGKRGTEGMIQAIEYARVNKGQRLLRGGARLTEWKDHSDCGSAPTVQIWAIFDASGPPGSASAPVRLRTRFTAMLWPNAIVCV